jgi:hypothetical protein
MKGAGTAADWCDKVGGEIVTQIIDMGSLSYYKPGANVAQFKLYDNNPNTAIVCPGYTFVPNAGYAGVNKTITVYNGNIVIVADDNFVGMTAAQVATAMAGTKLIYALATPVPFTWAEPLNLGVKVDENGTERAVAPEGATAPSAPFVADTTYTMSVARMVEKLQNL